MNYYYQNGWKEGASNMKYGVSSYSYLNLVESGEMKQIDVIKKAKEMGFDAIEFINFHLEEGETAEGFAKMAREESERVGIDIEAYTISADLLNGCEGDFNKEIERIKREVDIARILGAKVFRHDATYGFSKEAKDVRSFDAVLPKLIEGCRAITEYAEQFGIKTMVENHGYFCQDSERVEKLVDGVNHKNFGVLIDIGNFACADEDSTEAVARLMPYASHIHAKDFHKKSGMGIDPGEGWFKTRAGNYLRGSIIGHGDIPVKQCLSIVKDYGYNNCISIEFEGLEDPITGIRIGLDNLKEYFSD